jgi:hypothetical protein
MLAIGAMRATSIRTGCRIAIFCSVMIATIACHRSRSEEAAEGGAQPASIGVAECDDYLSKYQRCVAERVPGDKKKAFEDALARTRTSWQALAGNPGARPGLPQACSLALQTARTTLKQYSCSW